MEWLQVTDTVTGGGTRVTLYAENPGRGSRIVVRNSKEEVLADFTCTPREVARLNYNLGNLLWHVEAQPFTE